MNFYQLDLAKAKVFSVADVEMDFGMSNWTLRTGTLQPLAAHGVGTAGSESPLV